MSWLTDNPMPVYVLGGIALVVLLVLMLKTGRGIVLAAMGGVILCIVAAFMIDSFVVTDREEVEKTLVEAAALAEQNRLEDLLDYISPSVPHIRGQAKSWISQASRIDDVGVSAIEITVNMERNPPTARAEFRIYAAGEARERNNPFPFTYFKRMGVDFQREGNRWRVVDYQREL
jgi:hypothetical protein